MSISVTGHAGSSAQPGAAAGLPSVSSASWSDAEPALLHIEIELRCLASGRTGEPALTTPFGVGQSSLRRVDDLGHLLEPGLAGLGKA